MGLAARWAVERVTLKERAHMDWLPHTWLKAARAGRMTDVLHGIDRDSQADAATRAQALQKWQHWVQSCRLQPMRDVAQTIQQRWAGILKALDAFHLHTGHV